MTTANVFNFGQTQTPPNLNAATSTKKMDKSVEEAQAVFSSMMNQVAGQNLNMDETVLTKKSAIDDSFDRYQYKDNSVEEAKKPDIQEKIEGSSDELNEFEEEMVETIKDELGVSEDDISAALESLGMTLYDLLNPKNLVSFVKELTGITEDMDLLMKVDFQSLLGDVNALGAELMEKLDLTNDGLQDLVAMMDVLEQPVEFQEEIVIDGFDVEGNIVGKELNNQQEEVNSVEDENETLMEATEVVVETKTETSTSDESNFLDKHDDTKGEKHSPIRESNEHVTVNVSEISVSQTENVTQIPTNYTSVDTLDLIRQVAENLKITIASDTSSMEMQLNPENLGKIYLHVSTEEGVVRATIAAQNEVVKEALEAQVATLRENLNQSGVKVDAIEVTVASHEFERNLDQNHKREEEEGAHQEEMSKHRRNINLSSLDELSGLMTEEEQLVAQIMKDNGNSVDLTA